MYNTLAAAENAALEGRNQSWDSQVCRDFQVAAISSPPQPADAVASDVGIVNVTAGINVQVDEEAGDVVARYKVDNLNQVDAGNPVVADNIACSNSSTYRRPAANPEQHSHDTKFSDEPIVPEELVLKQVSNRGPQRADSQANGHFTARPPHQHWAARAVMATTDGMTQRSTLSLTQENSESAYEQFGIYTKVHGSQHHTENSPSREDVQLLPTTNFLTSKHQSLVTDSTAHTYGENDMGHIRLDLNHEANDNDEREDEREASQDPWHSTINPEYNTSSHSIDPQTPAPPKNPFANRGSVMKGHELFGATQPSSIGRHLGTPTSSRPSPDVYHDFTSPPQRRNESSPLRRILDKEQTSPALHSVVDADPLSSSQVHLPISRVNGVYSSAAAPTVLSSGVREPRFYKSIDNSRIELLKTTISECEKTGSESDSDDLSDIGHYPRRRIKEMDRKTERQLAAVALRRGPASSRPRSSSSAAVSRPPSSVAMVHLTSPTVVLHHSSCPAADPTSEFADVQVPSTLTSRRRSDAEEYQAQCVGLDARDTQPEEVVADSQKVPNRASDQSTAPLEEEEDEGTRLSASAVEVPTEAQAHSDEELSLPAHGQSDQFEEEERATSESSSSLSEEHLPLPKSPHSPVQNIAHTPTPHRNMPTSDMAVPETSRMADKITPINAITSFSKLVNDVEVLEDLPGFTQDDDFDNALHSNQSTRPQSTNLTKIDAPIQPQISSSPEVAVIEKLQLPMGSGRLSTRRAVSDLSDNVELDEPVDGNHMATSVHKINIETTAENDVVVGENHLGTLCQTMTEHVEHAQGGTSQILETRIPNANNNDEHTAVASTDAADPPVALAELPLARTQRHGLRTKSELKGPSRALRRAGPATQKNISRQSSLKPEPTASKPTSSETAAQKPSVTKRKAAAKASKKSSAPSSTVPTEVLLQHQTPEPVMSRRTSKRISGPVKINYNEETLPSTRTSKRDVVPRASKDSSEDPLAIPSSTLISTTRPGKDASGLFGQMAFAVSYVNHEEVRNSITKLIVENGGQILQDGFDCLFESGGLPRPNDHTVGDELCLSKDAKTLGFVALIADEHSRKAKYMQALALGLPCISGQWILACSTKAAIIDWAPYLLCAGRSSVLGDAFRSRTLQPYSAIDAKLVDTFESRDKILGGKSIILVNGKGKLGTRQAYVFLARALGPARVLQVADLAVARNKLVEADKNGEKWDLLYVDGHEDAAQEAVFSTNSTASGLKKRKRAKGDNGSNTPAPKRVRVISDEVVVQSLILGQLLDE